MRQRVSTGSPWEDLVGYSRAVRVGDTIHCRGTTAVRNGQVMGVGDAYTQATVALEIVAAALAQLGRRRPTWSAPACSSRTSLSGRRSAEPTARCSGTCGRLRPCSRSRRSSDPTSSSRSRRMRSSDRPRAHSPYAAGRFPATGPLCGAGSTDALLSPRARSPCAGLPHRRAQGGVKRPTAAPPSGPGHAHAACDCRASHPSRGPTGATRRCSRPPPTAPASTARRRPGPPPRRSRDAAPTPLRQPRPGQPTPWRPIEGRRSVRKAPSLIGPSADQPRGVQ